ncbi:MAG: Cys-Gln thioester bond-forming surface protein [Phycisphaerales bacterium]
MNRSTILASVFGSSFALAGAAFAAPTAEMAFTGAGKGSNVKIVFNGNSFNAFSGQLKHTISGATGLNSVINGDRRTFCIDLSQHVNKNTNTYEIVDIVAEVSGISPAFAGVRGAAISGIYNTFGSAAIGSTNATSNDFAAAFQLAVWELAYDFTGVASSINLAAGVASFKKTDGSALSGGILTQFNNIISAVGNGPVAAGLVALRSGNYQDQLVYVPGTLIPSAGSAAMAALGGLLIARRRRGR